MLLGVIGVASIGHRPTILAHIRWRHARRPRRHAAAGVPALSVHESGITASGDVTIDGFTLAKLDSFTLDTEYNYDGTIVSDYGHYCSNDARAEVLYDYDDWGECSTANKMQIAPAAISSTATYAALFGTDDSDDNFAEWR